METWANLRLEFSAEGADDKHVAVCPIHNGEDILEAVEKVGRLLVNSFAKDAANRLVFAKHARPVVAVVNGGSGSIVDSTVDRLSKAPVA